MNDWVQARATFTHDRMKNGFVPKLGALINMCCGQVAMPNPRAELWSVVFEWREARDSAQALIDSYEWEMSPSRVLNTAPLSRLRAEDKAVLSALVQCVWLKRRAIQAKMADATSCMSTMDDAVARLEIMAQSEPLDDRRLSACAVLLQEVRRASQQLTEALRGLPQYRIP